MNTELIIKALAVQQDAVLVADATSFGSATAFSFFAHGLAKAHLELPVLQLVAVSPLFWTDDKARASWSKAGWMHIIAHPWPSSLMKLRAVRRLWAKGNTVFISRSSDQEVAGLVPRNIIVPH